MRYITHEIETKSRIIFEKAMAGYKSNNVSQALFRQITERDYGVDGQVELFSDGMPTGKIAYIQLKGTAKSISKLKRSEEVSCSGISKSNIAYCNQKNVPVMLVYVSIVNEDFYFIDLQSVYMKALDVIGDNESGTVRIPTTNHSDNLDRFFEIINNYYDSGAKESIEYDDFKEHPVIEVVIEKITEDEKNYSYIVGQHDIPSDGPHKVVNVIGEVLSEGDWKADRLEKGTEYDYLIKVTSGELIFKPDNPLDPYDSSVDFSYEKMEPYGFDPLIPFSFSGEYIEHEGIEQYYVVDIKVDGDLEQIVNIRTLEEFLKKKNPRRLKSLIEMIALERNEE